MPIYEYRCQNCESHFEKMQKVSDAPLEDCEKCGGKLEKQWSLAGFQFKGAGWYVTDYSNKGKPEAKADAKTETKTEASNGTEKSSAGESTAKSESASNSTKSDASASKKE
jgi:putative FmdB family regulatory protein